MGHGGQAPAATVGENWGWRRMVGFASCKPADALVSNNFLLLSLLFN